MKRKVISWILLGISIILLLLLIALEVFTIVKTFAFENALEEFIVYVAFYIVAFALGAFGFVVALINQKVAPDPLVKKMSKACLYVNMVLEYSLIISIVVALCGVLG